MKKFLAVTAGVVLATCSLTGFSACKKEQGEQGNVTLTEIDATKVGMLNDVDYYVVPEPAASFRVNKLTAEGVPFYNVGSLQELYGGNGYPQAVIVAKNSLIETDGKFVNEFITKYANTSTWLASATNYADIVADINSVGGTLVAKQITKEVVANCSINYVPATQDKANVISYMNSVNAINPNMYGECADSFFFDTTTLSNSVTESKTSVSVFMPDGAPALSMAYMLSGEGEALSKTVNYSVVPATAINSKVTNADDSKNADICVLPVNAAAKVLGNGQRYKLLGTVTHGNLFILSKNQTKLTSANIATRLKDKRVGVINLSAVPGLTFKMVLQKNGLKYTQD